jgi:hypothetical protein
LKMVPVPCAVAIKDDEEKDEDDVAQVEKLWRYLQASELFWRQHAFHETSSIALCI